ncbi:HupE/UreJ family protein [Bradyrhizobium sp. Pa8]|uniref:HupE/UreJ family protein n=1 Tax=Bradyrhizobium sp. Pa8 TaxID=3386552 RepID=UPI00403F25F7
MLSSSFQRRERLADFERFFSWLARIKTFGGAVQPNGQHPPGRRSSLRPRPTRARSRPAICTWASSISCSVSIICFFVLALVILVRDGRRVIVTPTAFTLAYSLTLATASLGFVSVPGPPHRGRHRAQHRAGC